MKKMITFVFILLGIVFTMVIALESQTFQFLDSKTVLAVWLIFSEWQTYLDLDGSLNVTNNFCDWLHSLQALEAKKGKNNQ